jgi:AraC family transcriptional regulator
MTTLTLKNMVCARCVRVVREELEQLGYPVREVVLGTATVSTNLTAADRQKIAAKMLDSGFELLTDRDQQLVEQIKQLVIRHVHHDNPKPNHRNFSTFLQTEVGLNYSQLSKTFSNSVGMTIEKYLILQKVERAKELLAYGEFSLGEIAVALDYSSSAHLSAQFKKVMGLTPTAFKKQRHNRRRGLDEIG